MGSDGGTHKKGSGGTGSFVGPDAIGSMEGNKVDVMYVSIYAAHLDGRISSLDVSSVE